jgi:hypothetical protein
VRDGSYLILGLLSGVAVSLPVLGLVSIVAGTSRLEPLAEEFQVLLEVVPCPAIVLMGAVAP